MKNKWKKNYKRKIIDDNMKYLVIIINWIWKSESSHNDTSLWHGGVFWTELCTMSHTCFEISFLPTHTII